MTDSPSRFPLSLMVALVGVAIQLIAMPWRLDIIGLVLLMLGLALYNRRDDSLLHRALAPIGFAPRWAAIFLCVLGVILVLVIPAWHLESIGTLLLTIGIGLWGNTKAPHDNSAIGSG